MRGIFEILMVMAAIILPGYVAGEEVASLVAQLEGMTPYSAQVRYAVAMPMAEDDVVYSLTIASENHPADTLCGVAYIIDYSLDGSDTNGFTAYFDGHYYRYRDHRLLEYHRRWEPAVFETAAGGVQRNGQFVDLLPFSIAAELRRIAADTTYTLSPLKTSGDELSFRAVRRIAGHESQVIDFSFSAADGRPLKVNRLLNPGLLGEQEVTALYNYSDTLALRAFSSEEELMEKYPEVFERYRQSNFRVENLRGLPLPQFALPTPTRERYTYQKGEGFASPTAIAVLDPEVASAGATIGAVRDAVANLPAACDVIFMFIGNNTDLIEELTGQLQPGETTLTSATPFVRDTGVNSFPTIILCDREGVVADVLLGYSRSLTDNLLQRLLLLN